MREQHRTLECEHSIYGFHKQLNLGERTWNDDLREMSYGFGIAIVALLQKSLFTAGILRSQQPRRGAWLRTFVRCSSPYEPRVEGHSCNEGSGGMLARSHALPIGCRTESLLVEVQIHVSDFEAYRVSRSASGPAGQSTIP